MIRMMLSIAAAIMVGGAVFFLTGTVTGTAPGVSAMTEQTTTVRVENPAQLSSEAPNFNQWTADASKGSFEKPARVKRARVKASDVKYASLGAPAWDHWTREYPSGDFPGGAMAGRPFIVLAARN